VKIWSGFIASRPGMSALHMYEFRIREIFAFGQGSPAGAIVPAQRCAVLRGAPKMP
jgi:hypothetical protein